jgi:hypothetical protein
LPFFFFPFLPFFFFFSSLGSGLLSFLALPLPFLVGEVGD